MECARVDALRHAQRDLRSRSLDMTDLAQRPAHPDRGATCTCRMLVALEPEEQRIATELEQAAAVLVRHVQDWLEAPTDRIGDLLGTLAPSLSEFFGEF